eukprot:m.205159 g.205159  ORF g.205159 m.205159 type:complete len:336 (+) comp39657_c1_seq22:324-1331(+)
MAAWPVYDVLYLVLVAVTSVACYPAGAGVRSCNDLIPKHCLDHGDQCLPSQPSFHFPWEPTTASPYFVLTPGNGGYNLSIDTGRTDGNGTTLFAPGQNYIVNLTGDVPFKGFLVRLTNTSTLASSESEDPLSFYCGDSRRRAVGYVDSIDNQDVQHACLCTYDDFPEDRCFGMGHTSIYNKNSIHFSWLSPHNSTGCVYFHYSVLRNFSLFLERSVFKTCRDLTETPPPPTGITTHPVLTSTVNSSTTWNGTSAPPSASTQRSTSQWSTTGKPASSKTTTETTTTIRENCYSLYTNSHYSSKFICIYLSINSQQYGSTWKHSRNNIAFNLRHDSH